MDKHYATIESALHYLLEHRESQPSLAQLARHCHMSEYHLQRVFKQWAGVSPKRFLQCLHRDYARRCLMAGTTLLETSVSTGLSSPARLHDLFVTLEAVTPGEIRSGGKNITFHYGTHPSPFGDCFIAMSDRGIHLMAFVTKGENESYLNSLQTQWPVATFRQSPALTAATIESIFKPTAGEGPALKLWIKGSAFQFKVWEALLAIPEGRLASYSSIAHDINQARAARAVGSAVAKNPVAYLIPCHRVIKNMGVIGNYRWGELRKQAMVGRELASKLTD